MNLLVHVAALVVLPPLQLGLINRVKALAAGREGPPILQPWLDIVKLLRKGAVYSRTSTFLFRAGPIVSLACALCAGLFLPFGGRAAPLGFMGDAVAFAYLFGLARFFMMAAALDTGSSFEGMGASREGAFSTFAEPALFCTLALLCVPARSASLSDALAAVSFGRFGPAEQPVIIGAVVLFVVLLAEASRIPVDDPNTHLELTMVHEVMVLDHSGPDLALVHCGAAVKLFVLGALLAHLVLPISVAPGWRGPLLLGIGEVGVAIAVGVTESIMARLRLVRVPQFLIGASVLGAIGLAVLLYREGLQ